MFFVFLFTRFCSRKLNCLGCAGRSTRLECERECCGISSNRLLHHIVLLRIINEGQWGRSDADVALSLIRNSIAYNRHTVQLGVTIRLLSKTLVSGSAYRMNGWQTFLYCVKTVLFWSVWFATPGSVPVWVVIVPRKDCTTVLYHCTVSVLFWSVWFAPWISACVGGNCSRKDLYRTVPLYCTTVLCQCYFGACGLHPGSVPVWVVIVPRKDCTTVLYHCTVSVLFWSVWFAPWISACVGGNCS